MDMRKKEEYDLIICHYGSEKQMVKAIEELSELQKEICKTMLDDGDELQAENLIEEIADVRIMLDQLEWMLQIFPEVEAMKEKKIQRTIERIMQKE